MTDRPTTPIASKASSAAAAKPKMKMPPIEQLRGRQLGRILIKAGKLRRTQVHEALDIQKQKRGPLGQILVELGYITEDELNIALAAQSGIGTVELGKMDIPAEVIAVMSAQMVNTYRVMPFERYLAAGEGASGALPSSTPLPSASNPVSDGSTCARSKRER